MKPKNLYSFIRFVEKSQLASPAQTGAMLTHLLLQTLKMPLEKVLASGAKGPSRFEVFQLSRMKPILPRAQRTAFYAGRQRKVYAVVLWLTLLCNNIIKHKVIAYPGTGMAPIKGERKRAFWYDPM